MKSQGVPMKPGKSRFTFTLTTENVRTFQKLMKQGNLPPATLSNAVDDFIRDMNKVITKAMAQGSFSLKDMFHLMGDQLELLQNEEGKNDEKPTPETKRMAKKHK